jgi:CDP-diacylglycerol---glycerol-3-phosphate 3-phosphatidyltransferase
MVDITNPRKVTFTEWMRNRTRGILEPIAGFFVKIGLNPNTMTILGLIGNIAGALFLARGQMLIGGILILLMGPVDALDGTMARLKGMPTKFGGFVDSVTDRYSELFIFGGLLFYYFQEQYLPGILLVYAAASGSILVSYIRARGQSLGWDTKVGILTRMERYLVIVPALILNVPLVGLAIIALFANFTAIQRIIDIRRQARRPDRENGQYY